MRWLGVVAPRPRPARRDTAGGYPSGTVPLSALPRIPASLQPPRSSSPTGPLDGVDQQVAALLAPVLDHPERFHQEARTAAALALAVSRLGGAR